MNLLSVSIENFRCYQAEVKIDLSDLTVFIGKNDSGKSSILEALEIFFNNETVKLERGDCNIYNNFRLFKESRIQLPSHVLLLADARDWREFITTIRPRSRKPSCIR